LPTVIVATALVAVVMTETVVFTLSVPLLGTYTLVPAALMVTV